MEAQNPAKSCCTATGRADSTTPGATYLVRALTIPPASADVVTTLRDRLVPIPGGIFEMGARHSTFPADLDSPRRKVKVSPFLMSPYAVSNADYAAFISATGYQTVAEVEGWSFVFHLALTELTAHPHSPPGLPWWRRVDGACWSAPEGPGSSTTGREDHPAVHIAWFDALAYVTWAGLSLPSEAQWERAARGPLARAKFPWGNEAKPGGAFAMNTFQGEFPHNDTGADGWPGTAPVNAFEPNGYGMFNMTGNVWEWVEDSFGPLPTQSRIPQLNPSSKAEGHAKTQRGGSFLCHVSYCDRYHVHSRSANDPDSSTGNCGFRVAASPSG